MTPDGIAQIVEAPEEGSCSVPTSDSSARPHLESDGELSGPAAPPNHTASAQLNDPKPPDTSAAGVPTSSMLPPIPSSTSKDECDDADHDA